VQIVLDPSPPNKARTASATHRTEENVFATRTLVQITSYSRYSCATIIRCHEQRGNTTREVTILASSADAKVNEFPACSLVDIAVGASFPSDLTETMKAPTGPATGNENPEICDYLSIFVTTVLDTQIDEFPACPLIEIAVQTPISSDWEPASSA